MVVHPLTGIYKQGYFFVCGGSLRKVPPTQGKLLKEFMKGQCVKVLKFLIFISLCCCNDSPSFLQVDVTGTNV